MISIEKNKFPEFLKESYFLRNLDDEDDDLITVPKKVFSENDEVNNINDFKRLIRTVNYFGIDYPESLRNYSINHKEEIFSYFYPKSYKIEIKDMFNSFSDIFDDFLKNKTKNILDDIINFFEDLESSNCLESEYLRFYNFQKKYAKDNIKNFFYGIKTCIEIRYVKILYYIFTCSIEDDYTFFENIPSIYKDISLNEIINILEIECSILNLLGHKEMENNDENISRTYMTLEEMDTGISIINFSLVSNKKQKKIISNLIEYYRVKERNSKNEYKFYTHTEWDSNQTKFESLSNANLLGIKSKLNDRDVNILLAFFQCIIDNNYFWFEEESLEGYFEDADDFKMPKKRKEWIKMLKSLVPYQIFSQNEKPESKKQYLKKGYENFKQKYITLNEMNVNMKITEEKLIC